jgi:hypothetical protein
MSAVQLGNCKAQIFASEFVPNMPGAPIIMTLCLHWWA